MKITPQDIHHKEFKRGMRGYAEEEVDIFLDQLAAQFEKIYKQNHENEEKIHRLEENIKIYQNMELTLKNTLLTAQKSAEDIQENAKKEADVVTKNAKIEAKNLLEKAEKQRRVFTETFSKLKALEKEYSEKIKTNLQGFLGRVDKITAQESELVKEIEKAFEEVPEIEIPSVAKETPMVAKVEEVEKTEEEDKKKDEEVSVEINESNENKEEENIKADASKSDIASEEEIDKFLKQETEAVSDNGEQEEKKKKLLNRIFNRKSQDKDAEEEESDEVQEELEAADKDSKEKVQVKTKSKKNKQTKKDTEEINETA